MELFIVGCVILVGGFGALLLLSTLCMGKPVLIRLQVMMGSLKYSKEIDDKIDLVLGKVDAGLYHVMVGDHTLEFYSKEKYPDPSGLSRYVNRPDIEIWIANKFYSYGNIYRMNGDFVSNDISSKRPSVKLMKQIYELEKSKGQSTTKVKKDKSKAKKVVLG